VPAAVMTNSSPRLTALLARVANGDQAAFRALYEATSAKLYGVVLRILKRRDIADEVLQEAYVRIWNNAALFDASRGSAISWMAAIARNRALDEVRRVVPRSIEDMPEVAEIRDPQPLASEQLEIGEDYARLKDCLDALEPQRRDIVKLAYLEGRSREELGRMFGAPAGTIKTWLHRSLKELKNCLSS
jgi:RNA polymerase sigma-70 factor (ECF subfamily)